jgi:hypothetical protein
MSKATQTREPRQARWRIIGLSLDPALARDVKTRAAKKGVSLEKLFEDMWRDYKKQDSGARS